VHIKAVDDAGHDKSIEKKVQYLEKVDLMIRRFADWWVSQS
jgi:2,3-bisphosphoglycerate-independent phosphoglycerate mutase